MLVDDLGEPVMLAAPPRRVASLVPSLTDALETSRPGLVAAATDYCTHPADLDVPRVGGSKYPNVDAVLDLAPDLVVANAEENRDEDVDALEVVERAVDRPGEAAPRGRRRRRHDHRGRGALRRLQVPEQHRLGPHHGRWRRAGARRARGDGGRRPPRGPLGPRAARRRPLRH